MSQDKRVDQQLIRAFKTCGEPNGQCHGGKPVVMSKAYAATLAFAYMGEELVKLQEDDAR